jgi:actin related protein 2/3 complex subunit 2
MILLEPGNRILAETVGSVINNILPADKTHKRDAIDVRLCDFDDVMYHIVVDAKDKEKLRVSMTLPAYSQFEEQGGQIARDAIFGETKFSDGQNAMVLGDTENGAHMTLEVDLKVTNGASEEDREALVQKIKLFKPSIVGGVFDYFFQNLLDGKSQDPYKFDLRSDTTVYFFPMADRVIIVYSLDFFDKVDKAVAKIFMQEFQDARRTLGAAPPCTFGANPPKELEHYNITENEGNLGYLSFAVLKSHIEKNRKVQVIQVLQTFRNYLQYHIKCSKSYFHSKMRARCRELKKVLDRAKYDPLDDDNKKGKKTASGKTFVRGQGAFK